MAAERTRSSAMSSPASSPAGSGQNTPRGAYFANMAGQQAERTSLEVRTEMANEFNKLKAEVGAMWTQQAQELQNKVKELEYAMEKRFGD